jgi:GT2 family glycosyltransferase
VTRVRASWPGVRLIASPSNLGFAAANNRGIRESSSELVLLLNPDTSVPRGAIDRLVAHLDARPDVAIVGPRIVDGEGRAELSFGSMIAPLTELRQKVLVVGNDRGVRPIVSMVDRMTRRTREVDWVSGACLLIRRADLEAAGLLDERFFLYTEDVDLCASVRKRGRTVLFAADVEIQHLRGRSAGATTAAAYRRSQLAFYAKHHPSWLPWLRAYLKVRGELPDNS